MDFLPAIINSMVHILMYTYYFASSFKTMNFNTRKVKPLITIIQLIQLVIIVGHTLVAVLPSCNASNLFYLQFVNILILIMFFSNFYIQNYIKNKRQ
jgi:hypothetical protein